MLINVKMILMIHMKKYNNKIYRLYRKNHKYKIYLIN